jgi:hypothetical protein
MSYAMSAEEAAAHMERAKMILDGMCGVGWTENDAFIAVSFAYVFMCKASGETDDKVIERIAKIAAAMQVDPPTEQ